MTCSIIRNNDVTFHLIKYLANIAIIKLHLCQKDQRCITVSKQPFSSLGYIT